MTMPCEVCNGSGFVWHAPSLVDFCRDCETGRGLERASGYRCPCCGGDPEDCVLTPTGCVSCGPREEREAEARALAALDPGPFFPEDDAQ